MYKMTLLTMMLSVLVLSTHPYTSEKQ